MSEFCTLGGANDEGRKDERRRDEARRKDAPEDRWEKKGRNEGRTEREVGDGRWFEQDLEGYKVLVCGDINSLPCPVQTAGCDFASIRIIAALSLPVISSRALIALRARRAIIHRLAPPLSANTPVNLLIVRSRRNDALSLYSGIFGFSISSGKCFHCILEFY